MSETVEVTNKPKTCQRTCARLECGKTFEATSARQKYCVRECERKAATLRAAAKVQAKRGTAESTRQAEIRPTKAPTATNDDVTPLARIVGILGEVSIRDFRGWPQRAQELCGELLDMAERGECA